MGKARRLKKRIEDEAEEGFEVDGNSDIPVYEKRVKEGRFRKI